MEKVMEFIDCNIYEKSKEIEKWNNKAVRFKSNRSVSFVHGKVRLHSRLDNKYEAFVEINSAGASMKKIDCFEDLELLVCEKCGGELEVKSQHCLKDCKSKAQVKEAVSEFNEFQLNKNEKLGAEFFKGGDVFLIDGFGGVKEFNTKKDAFDYLRNKTPKVLRVIGNPKTVGELKRQLKGLDDSIKISKWLIIYKHGEFIEFKI